MEGLERGRDADRVDSTAVVRPRHLPAGNSELRKGRTAVGHAMLLWMLSPVAWILVALALRILTRPTRS